jgi:spermidine/putrescine transport system substrate-binding protein
MILLPRSRVIALLLVVLGLALAPLRAANKEINLFAWSEYLPQSVLEGFTKETGIRINYETFASGEEMLAKMLAGGTAYDLVQPPDYIAEALIKNRLLVPLDYTKLPGVKNILPEYLNMAHDPEQRYTLPYMVSTVGIVVNTERVKEPITGLVDMFAPRHAGRIVVVDDARELVTAALYVLGYPLNEINAKNLAEARPLLAQWMKRIKLYDSDSPKTALLNGDVDLGYVWGGEAARLWAENPKFAYVIPKEGAHQFVDVMAIPQGAKNVEAAHRFLDYLLRPEVSKAISDEFPYTNPNGAARQLLSPEQLANPASYPRGKAKFGTFRHLGETGAMIDELITDLKNAR